MYIHDGSSFYVSDDYGDVTGQSVEGFFFRDTRFLSKCMLRINGERPTLLRAEQVDYFSASFYLTLPFQTPGASHPISIVRNRFIGNGIHEEIILENYGNQPFEATIVLRWDCDFADLFEVKEGAVQKEPPQVSLNVQENELSFDYAYEGVRRQTVIACDCCPAWIQGQNTVVSVTVLPKGRSKTCFNVHPVWEQERKPLKYSCSAFGKAQPEMRESMGQWLSRTPKLESDFDTLNHTFAQSILDLASLRFFIHPDQEPVLAAGLPWYMALFGRDSLITAYQCCWLAPDLGEAILRVLAQYQGREKNDFREEEPGKILHELRFGELTQLGVTPHNPYYGTVDATPLFLILLHEVFQWTGNRALVEELKEPALKALEWIDRYGDIDEDGFIEYRKRSSKGLDNQGWKDSWNSMLFADGRLAEPPIAVVEAQGYVYDAKMRLAELAEMVWQDDILAKRLQREANQLKERIQRTFWQEADRGGYFALALDKDKRPVDAMTSNMGHLLWSGVAAPEQARMIADRLMEDLLYSGWGVRTMSTLDAGYNPIEYHNGTIWPHDNSLIVEGLRRYGFHDEANRIVMDQLEAARHFNYCLPEAFAGYPREPMHFPVDYPTANRPQAWAVGAPLLFLKSLLGLKADPEQKRLFANPNLPPDIGDLDLRNLRLFGKRFDLSVKDHHVRLEEVALALNR